MKIFSLPPLLLTILLAFFSASQAIENDLPGPSTQARFVPERSDDFAWENDLIAFRAYGPALRDGAENSGIDAWLKRVTYPIIDKWYRLSLEEGISYHEDHGEGLDNYKVGSSAGCGGTAIWINGKREPLETFTRWEIHEETRERTRFTLYYERKIDGSVFGEAKTISIELGQRLFQVESFFTKDGEPANDLQVCVGLVNHGGKAEPYWDAEKGWIAYWGPLDGGKLGTGARMKPGSIDTIRQIGKGGTEKHLLLIATTDIGGRIRYEAGYGWEKAGDITTRDSWINYLNKR